MTTTRKLAHCSRPLKYLHKRFMLLMHIYTMPFYVQADCGRRSRGATIIETQQLQKTRMTTGDSEKQQVLFKEGIASNRWLQQKMLCEQEERVSAKMRGYLMDSTTSTMRRSFNDTMYFIFGGVNGSPM